MKVLIVAVDRGVQHLLVRACRRSGFSPDVASSAAQALSLAQIQHFDVFVVEATVSGSNGLLLCRQLRAIGARCGIILLTRRQSAQDKRDGLYAGANECLCQPFQLSEVIERMQSLWQRFQSFREKPASEEYLPLPCHVLPCDLARLEPLYEKRECDVKSEAGNLAPQRSQQMVSCPECVLPFGIDVLDGHEARGVRLVSCPHCESEYEVDCDTVGSLDGQPVRLFSLSPLAPSGHPSFQPVPVGV